MSKRTKTCRWCEWFTLPDYNGCTGSCWYNPITVAKYPNERYCGQFDWDSAAMQEMLEESEQAVKESMDFSSKGKG